MAEVKKQEKDYTKEVDELLPAAQSLAKVRFADWFLKAGTTVIDAAVRSHRQGNSRMPLRNCSPLRNKREMYVHFDLYVLAYFMDAPT